MSRREHITEQSYIDCLKSMGCVFYAPLDYDNGLTELIHNEQPTIQSGATVSWSTSENMYKFKIVSSSTSPNERAVTYSIPDMGFENGGPITLLCTVKVVSVASNYNSFFGMPDAYNIIFSQQNCAYICKARYSGVNFNNKNKYAHTVPLMDGVHSVGLKWYCNGTLYTTSNWTGKVVIGSNTVSICQSNNSTGNNEIYVQDAMIFNRELSLAEIKEIQQIS